MLVQNPGPRRKQVIAFNRANHKQQQERSFAAKNSPLPQGSCLPGCTKSATEVLSKSLTVPCGFALISSLAVSYPVIGTRRRPGRGSGRQVRVWPSCFDQKVASCASFLSIFSLS